MRRLLDSLRWRLAAAMLLVFTLGLLAAALVDPPDIAEPSAAGWLKYVTEEPYQDFLVLVPYTLVALCLIWAVSGWSMKRLAIASKIAATIGPDNATARIPTTHVPSELRPLIEAANGALDRLAESYEAEQRFVAQVAHQLRTPLAVASLRVQRARSGTPVDIAGLENDLRDLQRFTERLLDLARREHARHMRNAPPATLVNLARTGREVAANLLPLFDHAGRHLQVELPTSLTVRGHASDLSDLVANLVENALKHGRGDVKLAATSSELGGLPWAVLTVSDQGPGIRPELRDRIFSRFARGDAQARGHGLGLAIVREIAQSHGGSVMVDDIPETRLVVHLPLAMTQGPKGEPHRLVLAPTT